MRLKAIKLAGFKSFVDPTTVPFPSNMTAIVGPNGCGKSNTIDAVRWVMGESSAKYLRGDSMTDVIFNGSSERKPIGKASVDLVFDNSQGLLKGEYASYAEISVRRQVTRDGQSTYFLNGTKCRRKDITDIFLGTGLGPRSYAIIEQGMISRLIEAKPEELRVYVEEAAGISRYKDRRRETENRIRRTRENLERLSDIREELSRQLAHLQRQAEAAEKYKQLKEQERQKKAEREALKWRALDADYQTQRQTSAEIEVQFEAQMAAQTAADADIEALRVEQTEKSDAFNQAQSIYYEVGSRIAAQEQKIEYESQRSAQLALELEQVENDIQQQQLLLENSQLKQEDLDEILQTLEPEIELLSAQQEQAQEQLVSAQEDRDEWQKAWDSFTQKSSEPARLAEVAQTRIQNIEQQLQRLNQQAQRIRDEQSQLQQNPEREQIELLAQQVQEQQLELEEKQENYESLSESIQNKNQHIEQKQQQIQDKNTQLQEKSHRQTSLKALQKAALGGTSQSMNHWLESHQLMRKPKLMESLQVEAGWELAVETVLQDYLQAIVLDDPKQVSQWLEDLDGGKLCFWQHAQVADERANSAQSLAQKISTQQPVYHLLNHILCAENLTQAYQLLPELEQNQSIITQDGFWLSKNWLKVHRASKEEGGVIARKQELDVLDEQIEELEIDLEELEVDLDSARLNAQQLEQQRIDVQRQLQALNQSLMSKQTELSGKQARAEQFNLRAQRLEADEQELKEQQQLEQEDLAQARLSWQDAMNNMQDDSQERERLSTQKMELDAVLQEAQMNVRDYQESRHQAQLKLSQYQSQRGGLKTDITRVSEQLQNLKERKQTLLTSSEEDNQDTLVLLKSQLEDMLEKRLEAETDMAQTRSILERVEKSLSDKQQIRAQAESQALTLRSQLEALRMQSRELEVRKQTIADQLAEQQIQLETLLEALDAHATLAQWDEQIEALASKIQRLGAINLAAIDEFKTQSERKVYLDSQNDDLEKALSTLEGAIQKIDRETRTRFKETFERMNAGLADLFPKVFGGGHAWLQLTGDDLLNTGVAIMARPPGKKNSTIHLLSGGEKALTAIALVFSIFQLNPAPFCMLDEVDAPLDDANVGRYANLVKAMSDQVQFIYITHNKIAMEKAEQLMGVTMNEPGVSRLVSVNVEQAAQMIDA